MDWHEIIKHTNVSGLDDAIVTSGYPMCADVRKANYDPDRLRRLSSGSSTEGHDNALCGIVVHFDLTFTIKAWTEAERYHFLEIISSQSTMHRIQKMELDEAYIEYVDYRMIDIMNELKDTYNQHPSEESFLRLVYSNPVGMKLTAGMVTNYRALKTIYKQRKSHRLPEWKAFCNWVETLPMSELITGKMPC